MFLQIGHVIDPIENRLDRFRRLHVPDLIQKFQERLEGLIDFWGQNRLVQGDSGCFLQADFRGFQGQQFFYSSRTQATLWRVDNTLECRIIFDECGSGQITV